MSDRRAAGAGIDAGAVTFELDGVAAVLVAAAGAAGFGAVGGVAVVVTPDGATTVWGPIRRPG
jgi:hypothetical protein